MTRRIRLVWSAQGASLSLSLSLALFLLMKGCNFFSSILDRTIGPNDRPIRQRLINGNDLRVASFVSSASSSSSSSLTRLDAARTAIRRYVDKNHRSIARACSRVLHSGDAGIQLVMDSHA